MSDETIRALNRRVEELTAENATLKSESKDRRIKGKANQERLDKLRKAHDDLVKDRDGWKTKAEASAPELTAKVEELQAIIRAGKHRSAFDKAAEAAGVEPRAALDLWTLSGYKADAEEPDAAAITTAIAAAKESRPYLFRPAAGEGGQAGGGADKPAAAKLNVPVDNSRGGAGNGQPTAFKVTKTNLQDLGWMHANSTRINAAREAGTLVYE